MPEAAPQLDPSRLSAEVVEQLKFETLLADLSARFVNLPADQVDSQIEEAQARICECLGIDHSALWQGSANEPGINILTHLHGDLGITPLPDRVDGDSFFPWVQQKIMRRETVCVPSTVKVPSEANVDKATWEAFGIKSVLAFPLWAGDGPVLGAVSFAATKAERNWPEQLTKRLRIVAEVFASALARKRAEQSLRESEARLRLAASSANAGLWTLDTTSGRFWATDKAKELFGFGPTKEFDVESFLSLVHPDDRGAMRRTLEEVDQSAEEITVEYRIVRPDGETRWISTRGRYQPEANGELGHVMGVSIDITETKHVQEQLQKSYAEVKRLEERLRAESMYLREEIKESGKFNEIIGQSEAIKEVLRRVEQVAFTDSIVLITGETGTGKELIARAIHSLSNHKEKVMVKVDCAALPPTLIESELFGREKGAYTGALSRQSGRFETADGSTLFLDEIGELGVEIQAKLLRVVQDGDFERLGSAKTCHVNVRLIAATHRDLPERVKNGTFREDLFYRLNVFPIHVPPLRDRPEDIPLLVMTFVREFEKKMGKKIRSVPSRMMDELRCYPWPGNIRELRNVIERAVIVTSGEKLNLQLPKSLIAPTSRTLRQAEYQHIMSILERTAWRIKGPNGAATILGVKPSTLYAVMRRLHIPTGHERDDIPT